MMNDIFIEEARNELDFVANYCQNSFHMCLSFYFPPFFPLFLYFFPSFSFLPLTLHLMIKYGPRLPLSRIKFRDFSITEADLTEILGLKKKATMEIFKGARAPLMNFPQS